MPLPPELYIYTLSLPFERGTAVDVALWLGRTSASRPWLLTVLLAAEWSVRALRVPATSPSMTKDAERAKRVERWRRRRSGSVGRRALERSGRDRRCGRADGLRGLGRNGPPCERPTDVDAGYNGPREQALTYE